MDYLVGAVSSDMLPLYIKKSTGSTLSISINGTTYTDLNYIEMPSGGTSGQVLGLTASGVAWITVSGGGSGGTSDYTQLVNKPRINGTTIISNKTGNDYGLIDNPSGQAANKYLGTDANNQIAWKTVEEPDYPVTSVNEQTGDVVLDASDVGAVSASGGTFTGDIYSTAFRIPSSGAFSTYITDDYISVGGTLIAHGDATFEQDVTIDGGLEVGGNITSAGQLLTALTSTTITSIPAVEGVVYTYTLTGSETITFGSPTSGYMPTFELHLTQPSTAVAVPTWTNVRWLASGEYSASNPAPDLSGAGKTYIIKVKCFAAFFGCELVSKY